MKTEPLDFQKTKKYKLTMILLCIGYFIDFYDLTIFSASYVDVFRDSFNIYEKADIQQLYLKISSFYTLGIFCGAIFFGIMGDKIGRTAMIRYCILIYSVAMILSIFTTSITLFTILRFISGAGLAAEFATSSVLINELLPSKSAAKYTSLLYFCGILGGMTATYLGSISWQMMYLFGGLSGIILYIARKKICESILFLNLNKNIAKGNPFQLFHGIPNILKFLRLLFLIIPFNFLISIMFIFPRFMNLSTDLSVSNKTLLTGFFIGNLISTVSCNLIINKFKDFRIFVLINIIIFSIVMPSFIFIPEKLFFPYTILLGLLGGGLPTVWIQIVVKSYGTNLRSTAANTLFAFGRLSGILFNTIIGFCLVTPENFHFSVTIMVVIIMIIVLIALLNTKNNYDVNMEYLESKKLVANSSK
ncbi:MFS transporter [Silvanigrella aquatica]|uniref:Major facilitator superfamily (MFS) profile domain-containing protein n=1 Tax=Silvanigrella aquatica TaxID=1915309 RepID=A0A1L4CX88_9BACT|nr:MFS transporter [Silvanigrella aquatica]APJ02556.1 hypothetical protein AXG55_00845 [Silvanigrella aquatica]